METLLSIIVGIIGIFGTILRIYLIDKEKDLMENSYDKKIKEQTERFNEALIKQDVNTISIMLNELRKFSGEEQDGCDSSKSRNKEAF